MERKEFLTTMAARMLACGSLVLVKDAVPTFAETTVNQAQQSAAPQRGRRPVVPIQVIEQFRLQPTEGYSLWVMGEDGKPYSLDEVLSVLFVMLKDQWGGDTPRQMAPKKARP